MTQYSMDTPIELPSITVRKLPHLKGDVTVDLKVREVRALLTDFNPQEIAEFKQLVARGMNTWDTAPEWLHQLYDMLHPVG